MSEGTKVSGAKRGVRLILAGAMIALAFDACWWALGIENPVDRVLRRPVERLMEKVFGKPAHAKPQALSDAPAQRSGATRRAL